MVIRFTVYLHCSIRTNPKLSRVDESKKIFKKMNSQVLYNSKEDFEAKNSYVLIHNGEIMESFKSRKSAESYCNYFGIYKGVKIMTRKQYQKNK
jgi:hypothetical protein